ncbi:MarR family transcriptional regulator [Actinoplanes sp. NPDC089786]|uniref:MarR family winged helix-turn-helix transcriptional regulator n=1 Tax=Actinoplanes sp. NPDC089786 TaxID=3155185 RepID=UPI003441F610
MSSEYPEPPELRALPEAPRALLFALLDLSADVNTVGNAAARAIGINQTDLICLNLLFQRGPATAGELASAVGLTTGATTTVIDRLERAGYVRRTPAPDDRRKVLVTARPDATGEAFTLFDDLMASLAELTAGYRDDQVALLTEMLTDFRARLTRFAGDLKR